MADDILTTFESLDPEDRRRYATLFNDVGNAPGDNLLFGQRQKLTDYLWKQGWRRDVRPEDVNDHRGMRNV